MLELLLFMCGLILVAAFGVFLLKILLTLLVIPFKLAWWMARGILGLLIFIPLALVLLNVFAVAFPLLLIVLLLPLVVGGALIYGLIRIVF